MLCWRAWAPVEASLCKIQHSFPGGSRQQSEKASGYSLCPPAQLLQSCPTPWTVACQAPLSMVFSRQEYWSGLPFPTPEDLPNSGIEPVSPVALAMQVYSLLLSQSSHYFSQFSSVTQSCLTLRPHESQHARPPCPPPTPRVHPNSCPSSRSCHPAISSSVVPFSHLQSFPELGSF